MNKDLKKFLKNTQLEVREIEGVYKLNSRPWDIELDNIYFITLSNIPTWSLNDNPFYLKVGDKKLFTFDKNDTFFLDNGWVLLKWNKYHNGELDGITEGISNNRIFPYYDINIDFLQEELNN